MGTAFTPARTSPASWDAFNDVDAFVNAVLVEFAAMVADGTRSTRSGPKPPLTGVALRKAIMDTAVRTARTSPSCRDAFADVDAFVDEVLAPDKVLTERAYRYRNAPDYRLLAHDTRSLPQLLPRHTKLIMSVRRHRG
jgi:hypothetical protein